MSTLIHTAPGIGHFVKESIDEVEKRISNHMLQDFVTFRGLADEKVLVSPKKVTALVDRGDNPPRFGSPFIGGGASQTGLGTFVQQPATNTGTSGATVYGTTGGFFGSDPPRAETSE